MLTTRLTADLIDEAWWWENLVAYHSDVFANAEVAVAALSGYESISDEAFVIGAYRATQYRNVTPARATYDELVSTGEIGRIADDSLRGIANFVYNARFIENLTEEGRLSEFRARIRRGVPADVQRALLESCGDRPVNKSAFQAIVGSLNYACNLNVPPARISAAATALRSDSSFLPALYVRCADIETALTDLTQTRGETRNSLRRIAGLDS